MKKEYGERVRKAVASISQEKKLRLGLILGSGLGDFVNNLDGETVSFGQIDGYPEPTVEGHQGVLKISGSSAVLAGRFHFYEGHDMDTVVLPVFLLHGLGVRTLIVTNASGGINREYSTGDLVLIRAHINLMGLNPLYGPNPEGFGPRFPDMSQAYSQRLRIIAREAAKSAGLGSMPEGIYAAFSGPSYETPAEVDMARRLGADLVGMSTVPEVIAANYLGMEVLGISCVTNMAAGILVQPLSHEEVVGTARQVRPVFTRLLQAIMAAIMADVPAEKTAARPNSESGK